MVLAGCWAARNFRPQDRPTAAPTELSTEKNRTHNNNNERKSHLSTRTSRVVFFDAS